MARSVFYSFHYNSDNSRVSQVRNMGVVDGSKPATDNDWETIAKGGEETIKKWIAKQMDGRSCVVVLIGQNTAGRTWITYEINKAWNDGKGILGVYIHGLKNLDGKQSLKGGNPFDYVHFTQSGAALSTVARAYDPPYLDSKQVYGYIKNNLADWIEDAIKVRNDQ